MVVNIENILLQEGGLDVLGTGFVTIKIKSDGLINLDVLEIILFSVVEIKYTQV